MNQIYRLQKSSFFTHDWLLNQYQTWFTENRKLNNSNYHLVDYEEILKENNFHTLNYKDMSPISSREFLIGYDVINSKKYPNRFRLQIILSDLNNYLNKKYYSYLIENNLRNLINVDKGFKIICGDCSLACVDNIGVFEIIKKDANYFLKKYDIYVRWASGKDGWDKNIKRLVAGVKK